MEPQPETAENRPGPVGGGCFLWRSLAIWLLAAPALGAVVAWMAVIAQSEFNFAPLVIFPLLVGVLLGAMLVGLIRLGQAGNRATAVVSTVAAVLVAVVGGHYFSYLAVGDDAETLRIAREALPDQLRGRIPKPPADFLGFLRQQAAEGRELHVLDYKATGVFAWLSWVVDGLLVLAAALALVVPAMRQPYCNCCRSWYRVIRSGRIDGQTARRLGELAGVDTGDCTGRARYRLLSCNGGCGPTAFELSWQRSKGDTSAVQAWLDANCRNRVMQVLDEAKAVGGKQ